MVTRNMRENLQCLINITMSTMPGLGHVPIFGSGLWPEYYIPSGLGLGHMPSQGLVVEAQHGHFQRSSSPRPWPNIDILAGADPSNQKA